MTATTAPEVTPLYRRPDRGGTGPADPAAEAARQAERLLAEARAEAERLRAAAVREGRAEGFREGLRRALADLSDTAVRFADAQQAALDGLEPRIAALAVRLAGEIVAGELAARPEAVLGMVRSALAAVRQRRKVILAVPASAAAALEPHLPDLRRDLLPRAAELRLKIDDALPPGGLRIESELGVLDASLSVQLSRLEAAAGE
jgi:flagellar biosynthesis/type III secretory pathway protein FliH